jgi:hypothetical protein
MPACLPATSGLIDCLPILPLLSFEPSGTYILFKVLQSFVNSFLWAKCFTKFLRLSDFGVSLISPSVHHLEGEAKSCEFTIHIRTIHLQPCWSTLLIDNRASHTEWQFHMYTTCDLMWSEEEWQMSAEMNQEKNAVPTDHSVIGIVYRLAWMKSLSPVCMTDWLTDISIWKQAGERTGAQLTLSWETVLLCGWIT